VALNTSQFPLHPSRHLEHSPLQGTILFDRFVDRVASLPFGLCKFIAILVFNVMNSLKKNKLIQKTGQISAMILNCAREIAKKMDFFYPAAVFSVFFT
jgi:hypothetical protein